jgi:hypothetical protein
MTSENGNTERRNGKFAPGNPGGPGRPPGSTAYDIRAIAKDYAAKEGLCLEESVWKVLKAMIDRGTNGDVHAAKLVLDRLCQSDPVAVRWDDTDPEEVAQKVQRLMDAASKRKKAK